MSGAIYPGVGGVARKAKHIYVGVGGVARKVKRIYAGVGGVARLAFSSEVTVAVNGAPGETVSYTGEASGSVVLDSHGAYSGLVLDSGNYTFTGSVSGYSKAVTLSDDGTVNVYPDGALFWYGNGNASGDSLWSKLGGWSHYGGHVPSGGNGGAGSSSQSVGANSISVNCSCQSSPTYYGGTSYSNNAVSLAGYSTIHAKVSGDTNNGAFGWGCPSARAASWETSIFSAGSAAKAIPSGRTTGYLALAAYNCRFANNVYGYAGITASAIWLE